MAPSGAACPCECTLQQPSSPWLLLACPQMDQRFEASQREMAQVQQQDGGSGRGVEERQQHIDGGGGPCGYRWQRSERHEGPGAAASPAAAGPASLPYQCCPSCPLVPRPCSTPVPQAAPTTPSAQRASR